MSPSCFVPCLALALLVVPLASEEGATAAPLPGTTAIGDLAVVQPWSRATARSAQAGAVFATIANHGVQADRLLAADSPAAARVELHAHVLGADQVLRMGPVAAIPVPPAGSAELKPGAYHIMLLGLRHPLDAGTRIPVAFTFARAGTVTASVLVGGPADGTAAEAYAHLEADGGEEAGVALPCCVRPPGSGSPAATAGTATATAVR